MIVPALVLVCWLSGPSLATEPPEVMVYAAASMTDALQSIAPLCEQSAGVHMVFNFGSSNDLAHQITAANRADLFVSADESWMQHVADHGLLDVASRRTLLSNRLALIVPLRGASATGVPADLGGPAVRRVALANPEAVPAGRYARSWLEAAGLWEAVQDRVVPALDVRAALAAVEAGVVDAGIVYRTDAALSRKVRIVYEVPENEGPRISYPAAALAQRPRHEAALRSLACLSGERAAQAFERFGFIATRP